MEPNQIKSLKFSKLLNAKWIRNVQDYSLTERTIVVNLGNEDAAIDGPNPRKVLLPFKSTILKGVSMHSGDSLVMISIPETTNIGGVVLEEGWNQYTKVDPNFPSDVPLYKSPQFEVGTVQFDPYKVTGSTKQNHQSLAKKYQVKVNVWFSPAETNCGIHNHHTHPEMLEVHTQIYGTGRMQKFSENDFQSLYEDVIMSPGFTHDPFTGVKDDGKFYYGWHQYYSDTDCIWMANEFHPLC